MRKTIIYLILIVLINAAFIWILSDKDKIEKIAKETLYPENLLSEKLNEEDWIKKDSLKNKELWFLEVQYPFKTNFTPFWNDYHENQYHAKTADFKKYFTKKDSVLLAIQIGPNYWDLWSFRQLIFHKIQDFVVVSNSYFRHNRFTYKGILILDGAEFSSFYKKVLELRDSTVNILGTLNYSSGYYDEKVEITDTIEIQEFYVECRNEDLVSGIIIDNIENQQMKLYGLSGTLCERKDSIIQVFRTYQVNNWLRAINEFEWKTTYPDDADK